MVPRPPDADDPTSEEEALDFDGTSTDQLDDTYRLRVVMASESANGAIIADGKSQASPLDGIGTGEQHQALDNPALALALEEVPTPEPLRNVGYDPYATSTSDKAKPRRY